MENQVAKEITGENIKKLKDKLPLGSYSILAQTLKDKYKPRTIEAMFCNRRTMKPDVFEAAEKFIEMINPS